MEFYALYQQAEAQVRQIIEDLAASNSAPGSVAAKVGDLYGSFMAEAAIEQLGIRPIQKDLDRALCIENQKDFSLVLGEFEARGLGGLFYQYITTDRTI